MARGGINKALVQKARQAILARGENPSIDMVRIELGNTGSKSTIHRYLKALEEAERGRDTTALPLSEQLANLIGQLSDQLKEEAQAAVAQEREQLVLQRLNYINQAKLADSRIQQLESSMSGLTEQLQVTQQSLQQEQLQRQQAEVENARHHQASSDLAIRLQDREDQIRSLEEKHLHARDALEHYRHASKEQREQEQRRHETQVQQLQLEMRQLQQSLIIKQEELTHLNRDNSRLLTEARQLQKEQHAQQQLISQKISALEDAQSATAKLIRANDVLEQRCLAFQDEVSRLEKASDIKTLQAQILQERINEATIKLKLHDLGSTE